MEWIIFICSALAILIFGIVIFRGNSDRRGIRNDIDSARRISTGLGTIGDSNQRTKAGLEELGEVNKSAQGRTDNISKHNKSAKTGIKSAIEILKRAKNRSNDTGS